MRSYSQKTLGYNRNLAYLYFLPSCIHTQQLPLIAFVEVVSSFRHQGAIDVQLATVVLPRLIDEVAALVVKRKPGDVDGTV